MEYDAGAPAVKVVVGVAPLLNDAVTRWSRVADGGAQRPGAVTSSPSTV